MNFLMTSRASLFAQKYTQSGGVRPYGLSTLIIDHDIDGTGHLFQTDPSGIYSEWHANAVGRNAKAVKEVRPHLVGGSSFTLLNIPS